MDLLTTREVAARLRLAPATVTEQAKRGEYEDVVDESGRTVPGQVKFGNRWRFHPLAVDAWIERHRMGPRPDPVTGRKPLVRSARSQARQASKSRK